MPYKRKYRKRKKRKYKKRKSRQPSTVVIRGVSLVPDRLFVKLKYSQMLNFTQTGVLGFNVFRGNSLFDPDQTGAGTTQPMGFDQWKLLYERYKVHASSISLRVVNSTSTVTKLVLFPMTDAVSLVNDINEASEQPYSKSRMITGQGGSPFVNIYNKMSTKKIRGVRIPLDDDYSANIDANPARQWFWHILCQDPLFTGTLDLLVDVSIIYYAEFMKRAPVNAS